eukprot:GEMP01006577.1.p1 GENE.GEMP01006577.1~~GEMP01006577.1.p1  ORF type:complete len:705 (+),score=157.51 GEMP01006577.1:196-2310(+)
MPTKAKNTKRVSKMEAETVNDALSKTAADAKPAEESRAESVEEVAPYEASSSASGVGNSENDSKKASSRETTDVRATEAEASEVPAKIPQNSEEAESAMETPSEAADKTRASEENHTETVGEAEAFEETLDETAEKVSDVESVPSSIADINDFVTVTQEAASEKAGTETSEEASIAENPRTETTKAAETTETINETARQAEASENKTNTETAEKASAAEGVPTSDFASVPQDQASEEAGIKMSEEAFISEDAPIKSTEVAETAIDECLSETAAQAAPVEETSAGAVKEAEVSEEDIGETTEDVIENAKEALVDATEVATTGETITDDMRAEAATPPRSREQPATSSAETGETAQIATSPKSLTVDEDEKEGEEEIIEKAAEQPRERQPTARPTLARQMSSVAFTIGGALKKITVNARTRSSRSKLDDVDDSVIKPARGSNTSLGSPSNEVDRKDSHAGSSEQPARRSMEADVPSQGMPRLMDAAEAQRQGETVEENMGEEQEIQTDAQAAKLGSPVTSRLGSAINRIKLSARTRSFLLPRPIVEPVTETELPQQATKSNEGGSEENTQQKANESQDISLSHDSPAAKATSVVRGSLLRQVSSSLLGLKPNFILSKQSSSRSITEDDRTSGTEQPQQSIQLLITAKNAELAALKIHLDDLKDKLASTSLLEESLRRDIEELEEQVQLKEEVAVVLARSTGESFAA